MDKNGKEYGRAIISEARSHQGIQYDTTVAVMAFGPMVKDLKAYKEGDTLKAICNERLYHGNPSYTILKILR